MLFIGVNRLFRGVNGLFTYLTDRSGRIRSACYGGPRRRWCAVRWSGGGRTWERGRGGGGRGGREKERRGGEKERERGIGRGGGETDVMYSVCVAGLGTHTQYTTRHTLARAHHTKHSSGCQAAVAITPHRFSHLPSSLLLYSCTEVQLCPRVLVVRTCIRGFP